MKKLTIILTIFLLGILTAFLVSAIDFTPKGDIDMQGYSIKGAKNISATGNVSANWLFAFLNWSNVQNAPTNSWLSTYNASYVPYTGADKTVYLNNQSLIIQNTKGFNVTLNNFVEHTQEMMTNTLLDKSRSTISIVNGQVNFTLFAVYGCGQLNFNGTLYPSSGTGCIANATVTLLNGSAVSPKTNYIHWYLNSGVPTMTTTESYPSYDHIDVGTFVIGNTSGTKANIYSYSRNRYEVDTLVKRVIERFEESGTLYVNGLDPHANTTNVNITTGEFFNGIFEMSTTNIVQLRQNGFYYINGTGNFVEANSLASFTQYANGVDFAGGANERVNIIWGIVPINTTEGTGPTQARLVAILPTYQGAGNEYTSVSNAITDNFDTANYFPPNSEVKAVFVPVLRTILRPNTDLFEPFVTGRYYQDIRGKVTNGGSSASSSSSNHAVLDNLDYATAGHTGFASSQEILDNNASWTSTYNATYAGKADYQFTNNNFNGSGNFIASQFFGNLSGAVDWSNVTNKPTIPGNDGITLKWVNLTDYPVACSANTFMTQVGDTITCTSVQETIVSLKVNGNLTVTNNISANNINALGNISADWLFALLNWSYIQNAPTSTWLSTYNSTYDGLIQWGYNQTTATYNLYNSAWTATYNSTYAGTSADVTANRSNWESKYNASYVPYTGATTNVALGNYNISAGNQYRFAGGGYIKDNGTALILGHS